MGIHSVLLKPLWIKSVTKTFSPDHGDRMTAAPA